MDRVCRVQSGMVPVNDANMESDPRLLSDRGIRVEDSEAISIDEQRDFPCTDEGTILNSKIMSGDKGHTRYFSKPDLMCGIEKTFLNGGFSM